MDFAFGEDHELLRETTRRFLSERQALNKVRRRIEEPNLFDAATWQRGAELGWTAMLVPAEHGGGSVTDQPLVDLIVFAEELGRELNPGPLVPCSVVADAITRYGTDTQAKEHLPQLARGETVAAWCLTGDGSPEPDAVEISATSNDDRGWRLDGVARYVHGARDASLFLVVAHQDQEILIFLVPATVDGISLTDHHGLDLTRRFAQVNLDGVLVPGSAIVPGGWEAVERGLAIATILQAAESVGAADRLFNATVEYAKKRVQFGRPIGSFQALKHRMADMLLELEGMRAATYYAALALADSLDDASEAVATAGAYVFDVFAHLCGEALQLHGGIGFTWEHDTHLFVRRAKVNQVLYGDGSWHRERLVRQLEQTKKPERV
jgi:alkylation response protein AidB-like acyl-CoA dehydrogenase